MPAFDHRRLPSASCIIFSGFREQAVSVDALPRPSCARISDRFGQGQYAARVFDVKVLDELSIE
jgi:hypothetical protein